MSFAPVPEEAPRGFFFRLFPASIQRRKAIAVSCAVAASLTLFGGLGLFKYFRIQEASTAAKEFRPPPATVTSIITRHEEWNVILNSVGTLQAVQGVTVCADLAGIVEKIYFASGTEVRQGDLLIKLDTRQEEAQLIAAKAKQDLASYHLKRVRELYAKNVLALSEYETAGAAFQEHTGKVKEIETQIARKSIRAPFSGLLGIRQINIGQYLQSGEKIVPLQSLDPIYVQFSLPQEELSQLQKSQRVVVYPGKKNNVTYEGTLTALNSLIDPSTANFQVQATLFNKEGSLRPGMFVHVEVRLAESRNVITVPLSAIRYAPYGDSVFVIKPMKGDDGVSYLGVEQRFIKLGATRGDRVIIESGLNAGEEIATSGIFNLRPGNAIRVQSTLQPSNELTPQPQDS